MPDIDWNKQIWDGEYDWSQAGDEWSSAWGSADAQWTWSLKPRINKFLSPGTILEIAPGYGRWSQYLLEHASKLILVDLSQACINACKMRFTDSGKVEYHVNDGRSLAMIEDDAVDLVFSFDSLVHCEIDVLDSYLNDLRTKLRSDGVIIIHHSNLGQFAYFALMRKIESILKPNGSISAAAERSQKKFSVLSSLISALAKTAMLLRITDRTHMRALSTSAALFKSIAVKYGFVCVSQEIIRWGRSRRPIDCISILTPKNSKWATREECFINKDFMHEAKYIKKLSRLYNTSPK